MKAINPDFGAADVAKRLSYDADGSLRWATLIHASSVKVGQKAGGVQRHGYRYVRIFGRNIAAHRLVWLLHTGRWPTEEIDHINGIRDDNRIENLREVGRSDNMQNRFTPTSSSGLLGASKYKGKFKARVTVNGVRVVLGTYDTAQEAHLAYMREKVARGLVPA